MARSKGSLFGVHTSPKRYDTWSLSWMAEELRCPGELE